MILRISVVISCTASSLISNIIYLKLLFFFFSLDKISSILFIFLKMRSYFYWLFLLLFWCPFHLSTQIFIISFLLLTWGSTSSFLFLWSIKIDFFLDLSSFLICAFAIHFPLRTAFAETHKLYCVFIFYSIKITFSFFFDFFFDLLVVQKSVA